MVIGGGYGGLRAIEKLSKYEDIDKNASLGDYLLISNSNARNSGSSVCFRINEFKIVKKNKESIENECWTNGGR